MKKVKFKRCSFASYQLLPTKDADAIYFILDKPFIYMNGVQYGLILDEPKHLINSLQYDNIKKSLVYTIAGSSKTYDVPVDIVLATELNDGLMSKEQVKQLNNLAVSLNGITDVKTFVEQKSTEVFNSEMTWKDIAKSN